MKYVIKIKNLNDILEIEGVKERTDPIVKNKISIKHLELFGYEYSSDDFIINDDYIIHIDTNLIIYRKWVDIKKEFEKKSEEEWY